jgi:hypothetical protein
MPIRLMRSARCARPVVGLTSALPSAAMNARRLIRSSRQQVRTGYLQLGKTQKAKAPDLSFIGETRLGLSFVLREGRQSPGVLARFRPQFRLSFSFA